jgi:hypothetical protein
MLNEEINIVHDIRLLKDKNQKILLIFSQIIVAFGELKQYIRICDISLQNCPVEHLISQISGNIQTLLQNYSFSKFILLIN